jgi:hypothetical protein
MTPADRNKLIAAFEGEPVAPYIFQLPGEPSNRWHFRLRSGARRVAVFHQGRVVRVYPEVA